ncbi:MAG: calmodulin-binding protein [Pirellulales bacterium]
MLRRILLALACSAVLLGVCQQNASADERAYGRVWGGAYQLRDWDRFYHYPYVFYPQNYWGNEYYRSSESLYYRYPNEMRIPVYNKKWQNELPQGQLYHWGNHFRTDVF